MPNTKGDKSVVIHRDLVPRLQSAYDRFLDPDTPVVAESFQRFINRVLRNYLDKEDFILREFPEIKKIAIEDNVAYLKDRAFKETVEVRLHDKELFCTNEESRDCKHVKFVYSMPESGRLYIKKPHDKKQH